MREEIELSTLHTLVMKIKVCFSETSASAYRTTQRHNSEAENEPENDANTSKTNTQLSSQAVRVVITNNSTEFWDVMPCSLVEIYVNFEGTCCYHLRAQRMRQAEYVLAKLRKNATRLHGVTSQKIAFFLHAGICL